MQPNTYITRIVTVLPALLEQMLAPQLTIFLKGLPEVIFQKTEMLHGLERQAHLDLQVTLRHKQQAIANQLPLAIAQHLQHFAAASNSRTIPIVQAPASIELALMNFSDIEIKLEIDKAATHIPSELNPILADAFLRLNQIAPYIQSESQMPFHPREIIHIVLDCFAALHLTPTQQTTIINAWRAIANFLPLTEMIPAVLTTAEIPKLNPAVLNRRSSDREPAPSSHRGRNNITSLNTVTADNGTDNNTISFPALNLETLLSNNAQGQTPFLGKMATAKQRLQAVSNAAENASNTAQALFPDAQIQAASHTLSDDMPSGSVQARSAKGSIIVEPAQLMRHAFLFAKISKEVAETPLDITPAHPLAEDHVLGHNDLDRLLSKLQQIEKMATSQMAQTISQVKTLRQNIRNQLANNTEICEKLEATDEDSINLVSILFECIFSDEALPAPIKVLLSRLQIPFVRIAIFDKDMFAKENHPARVLLNKLAKAAVGWDSTNYKLDALHKHLEHIVFTFLDEFNGDLTLIERLLQSLEAFLQAHRLNLAAVESRTTTTAESLAKAALFRQVVQEELNARLEGKKLPFAVVKILQEGWRNVLYQAAIRQGIASDAWKKSLKIVDALIWAMLPDNTDTNWGSRLEALMPKLLNSLRKGLASVNFDALQSNALLIEIESILHHIIAGIEVKTIHLQSSNADGLDQDAKSIDDVLNAPISIEEHKTLVLPETNIAKLYQGDTLPDDHPCLRKVRHLPVGTWVDFIQPNQTNRYKFVARIRSTEKLIFTNQRGIKVAEISDMQFAIDLSQARVQLVETNSEIFDRALKVMVNRINANAA